MSARPHPADRGLAAVARVRGVREQDSRIGLQLAAAESAARTERAVELHDRLATADLPASASPGELLSRRTTLALLGSDARDARTQATAATHITDEARAHWGVDRGRLAAVEHLLERRAAARRTERARKADREADDLAAQAWLRRRTADQHQEDQA